MPPAIVHLDADAFFASVEQAADPRLRGRPIAVGGERRGIIAAASYEARRYGVYTSMPTSRARRLCPSLTILPGNYETYEQFSRWMFSYAYDFTPWVEIASIDEGYFDFTRCRTPALEAAETLRRAITTSLKISVSEGIATCKVVSQIASKLRKPGVFRHIPPGHEAAFLAPLCNRALPGIGPVTGRRMDAAGLRRLGQIACTPEEALALLVGNAARQIKAFAGGIDPRPVTPVPPPAKSYSRQETFPEDVTDPAHIETVLRTLATRLMERVRAEGKAVRTVTLRIRYNDFDEDRHSESLPEPTDMETDLFGRLRPMLRRAWRRRVSLRMVALRLSQVYRAPAVRELALDPRARRRESGRRAADVMDELHRDRGRRVLIRGCELPARATGRRHGPTSPTPSPRLSPPASRAAAASHTLPSAPLLHVHSAYSFLDSTLDIPRLVEEARNRGWSSLALTDFGNLHGAVPFCLACRAAGIRPILGAELQLDDRPLLLYVETRAGYRNLCRLLTRGCRFTSNAFPLEPAGLIAVGADPAAAPWFARDAFFLGAATPAAARRAAVHGYPVAAVPAVHYASPADRARYAILQSIRTRTLLDHPHPDKQSLRRTAWLLSPQEMTRRFADTPDALAAARDIADRCRFSLASAPPQFPLFSPPDGATTAAFLRSLVLKGLRRRYGRHADTIRPQVEEELAIIHEVGYESYFLTVWDLLRDCRAAGIPWLTRGSAADSLVCYCLGISSVCPKRFGLYFQRFLNPERMKMSKLPDIDIDFPHDARQWVLDHIFEKYGPDHAAVVGGFSTYRARSALGDAAKVLGLSEEQIRRCTRRLPRTGAGRLRHILDQRPETADLPLDEEPYATAVRMAEHLDGFPRHPKMHPCGVVLSRDPITDLTPCFTSASGYPATHFDMDAVEAIGLVKFDILGQGGLSVIRDAEAALRARGMSPPPRDGAPWRDPAVWDMIATGNARAVHHIESPAMVGLARMCDVRDIDTLIALVSVIRPGAANQQKKQSFTRRHQGLESPVYPHPSLIPCLRGTYGLIIYEEQVLQVCEAFAGLGLGPSDRLRRALVKNRHAEAEALRPAFEQAARNRGRTAGEIEAVWTLLCGFSGYAFCKAHSTAYGVEAWRAAWLKRYHPAEFLAAVLTHGKGFYRPLVYVLEALRLGIRMAPPTVQQPGPAYIALPGSPPRIRVPATRAKGLRDETRKRLHAEAARAPFQSVADLADRTGAFAEELETLLRIGALDCFSPRLTHLFWDIQQLRRRPPATGGQTTLDERARRTGTRWLDPLRLPGRLLTEPDALQRLQWEMELLEIPVRDHPLALYPDIAWETYCPLRDIGRYRGRRITCCGMIVEDRVVTQENGELMKFMSIADWSGIVETELFAAPYRRYGLATVRYPVLEVEARVEPFENGRGETLRIHRLAPPRKRKAARESA